MAEFAIGTRMVGDGHPPLIVCELGVNHLGSMRIARDMIKAAADAGCECVKGQTHCEDEMVASAMPQHVAETIRKCSLDADQERELRDLSHELGLIYISTPFSIAAADRLHELDLPAYKIGSGELTNTPLLEHVASFGKPVIVSTGMAYRQEIESAVSTLEMCDVAIMHCTSMYPTPARAMRYDRIAMLQDRFEKVVGISDHSHGIALSLGAVALGAQIVEKHFTLSHGLETPDAVVSIDPVELEALATGARMVWEAAESVAGWRPLEAELDIADWARHSVTLRCDVQAGTVLTAEYLTCKRPAGGLPPSKLRECIGRRAARGMAKDWQVREGDLV